MFKRLMIALPLLVALTGCVNETFKQDELTRGSEMIASPILQENGFALNWQADVPIKLGESIRYVFNTGDYVLVFTSRNTVFCYNAQTGKLTFVRQISRPSLPLSPPSLHAGKVFTSVGQEVWSVDAPNAKVVKAFDIKSPTRQPVVFNSYSFYVTGLDRRISCYSAEEGLLLFQVTADNNEELSTCFASDNYFWFAAKDGIVYCCKADEPVRVWGFATTAQITAAIVERGDYVYVGSTDTILYKLNSITGNLNWKSHLGSPIIDKPTVYDDVVIQQTVSHGAYILDAATGKVILNTPDALSFLSRKSDRVFFRCAGDVVKTVSIREGAVVGEMKVGPIAGTCLNELNSMIILVSDEGKVACFDAIRTIK
ncbi:MAG: PQQ-binding-like beta-propeller repeat protein [Phycisphaerae bacterium]|jgi:outer membrane protein assembly factor BamB